MGRIDDGPWPGASDTSGMTSRLMLAYARREGGDEAVDAVLEAAGVAEHAEGLLDERTWFPFAVKIRLFEALAEVLGDPHATRHAGEAALDLDIATALKVALRALGSPRLVYQQVVRANGKFSTRHEMQTLELGRESARISFRDVHGDPVHPLDCEYNIGLLSCVPAIFGQRPARVTHSACGAAAGGDTCVYDIAWDRQAMPLRHSLAAGAAATAAIGGALAVSPALLPAGMLVAAGAAGAVVARAIATLRVRSRGLQVELDERSAVAQQLMGSLQDLAGELRVEEVLDKIVGNARTALDGRHIALLQRDEDGRLRCRAATGISASSIASLEGWARRDVAALAQPAVVEDVASSPELAPLGEDPLRPLRTLCTAPLRYRGELTGVLCALAGGARTFLPTDVELVATFATQAAIALGNAEQFAAQRELASRDPLTGLLNHREFHEALTREIARCRRHSGTVSTVLLDLDGFKAVNDTSGHGEGDRLLRAVGDAIVDACRESDSAFRIGGDEFAVILPHADEVGVVAERLVAGIAKLDARVGASYGVATWPDHGGSKDVLLAHADASLYAMKSRVHGDTGGRRDVDSLFEALPNPTYLWRIDGEDLVLERFNAAALDATAGRVAALVGARATELYAEEPDVVADLRRFAHSPGRLQREMSYVMRATGERRQMIVTYGQVRPGLVAVHTVDVTDGADGGVRAERDGWEDLVTRAVADGRLLVYSQPILGLADGLEPREELLVRMRDEGGNVLAPPAFLPHAERLGLIGAIDRWMIERAFELAATGRSVHVNLSARSLEDLGLAAFVTECLETTGAEASRVTFEVTETAAIERLEDAVEVATSLSALGCELALDDFGAGHAPLSYLAELPVDYIKIDMRFVRGLLTSPRDERVVRSLVRMAGEFGLETVAEGVEDAETLERLRGLGVDYAQGYHLGRP